ncbi:MAG TPA: heparan-alpha-glucosaminide N-acetyltransferase domain-containing protein [Blastocatellia bacterium]|nr:heparan-alpha-glucosaminide N-acetyltransferase domain-containing protein [Blastocatellia bacterium]
MSMTSKQVETGETALAGSGEKANAQAGRLVSLDAFRGITIAGMTLVNNPGTWSAIYPPLQHAEWHGWTPTDLVFPFFLFIVGVSITLSLSRHVEKGGKQRDVILKIVRRSLIIFALGLVIYGFPYYDLSTLRIPGVLQRIAVCYLIASIIFLKTGWKGQAIIAAALLLVYWLLMMTVPVPGFGTGDLSKEGNLAAYIDRLLLPGHTWTPVYDPEGLLSTIPAIATTLFGVLAGHLIGSRREPMEKVAGLFVAGSFGILIGWAWGGLFPINKALWTSSYAVFTAGMALQFLALCYWLIDIKGYRRWAMPFVVFGVNAIILYVLSSIMATALDLPLLKNADGSAGGVKAYTFDHFFASWASPINASLLWGLAFVLFWWLLMLVLYKRKIFIKV